MASETPGGHGKLPKKMPLVGLLLGFLVGGVVIWVTLQDVPESVRQIPFLLQIPILLGIFVCGGIDGIIQLWTQGRAFEIPRFFRLLLGGVLWMIFLLGSLFLGAWLGERLCGRAGYWIGSVATAVLCFFVRSRFPRLSSSEKTPVPPPA